MIYTLYASGYEAIGFTDGEGLFEATKTEMPKLIMLDITLPEESGITILKRLRKTAAFSEIPVSHSIVE